jgi:Xaa-Pro aminopeptidase
MDRLSRPPNPATEGPGDTHIGWVRAMTTRFEGVTACSSADLLERQRRIKTPYEQRVLTRSVEISAEAHVEGMKATRPGRWEYEVQAAIEGWQLAHGQLSWGYPSIVASGPNATTLHYLKSTRQMRDGELLLVDAAGNFQDLTGDITRTYPVNGRYSAAQREIYELVLKAQEAGIGAARPGASPTLVTAAVRAVFAEGLTKLGLIDPSRDVQMQVSLWFPHLPVHGIGVDVHDPLGDLDPGSAFVIEPGLYIRPDALDTRPSGSSGANAELARRLAPALEKYQNIGVRIEDSFLMTARGPQMLSGAAPRQIPDIERLVGTGR